LGELVAGKYRLVRAIGEGGMGVVFEAVHERLDQRVAVKMLLPKVLDNPDVVVRFAREARAAGRLRSRNAARVIDVETTDGAVPFLVMEFLEGHDLATELERRGPLPIDEAVGYLLQACNAMLEAHSSGIVHRDLKPSNLFLAQDGNERLVKVLDFGISKLTFEPDSKLTATQTTIGTPAYMSPEQVRSSKDVDERTDVWSLGVILYESLTGKLPFEGSPTAVAAAIVADTPERMTALRPDVPPDLEAAVAKTLAKKPADRFPDVRALALALAPFASPGSAVFTDTSARQLLRARPSVPFLEEPRTLGASDETRPHGTVPGWTARTERRSPRMAFAFFGGVAVLAAGGALLFLSMSRGARGPASSAEPLSTAMSMSMSTSTSSSTSTSTSSSAAPSGDTPSAAASSVVASPTTAATASPRPPARGPRPPPPAAATRPGLASPPVPPAPTKPKDPDHI
jgi:eukaryotic-like serine/threonine-protein kinase